MRSSLNGQPSIASLLPTFVDGVLSRRLSVRAVGEDDRAGEASTLYVITSARDVGIERYRLAFGAGVLGALWQEAEGSARTVYFLPVHGFQAQPATNPFAIHCVAGST